MQPASADILCSFIHLGCDSCNLGNRVVAELQCNFFGLEQCLVLSRERIAGLAQDSLEVFACEWLKFYPDREPSLELRNQVGRFGDVEGPRRYEQNVVCPNRSILGIDC